MTDDAEKILKNAINFAYKGLPGVTAPCLTFLESSRRADVKL